MAIGSPTAKSTGGDHNKTRDRCPDTRVGCMIAIISSSFLPGQMVIGSAAGASLLLPTDVATAVARFGLAAKPLKSHCNRGIARLYGGTGTFEPCGNGDDAGFSNGSLVDLHHQGECGGWSQQAAWLGV